jgi:hypothetical protein
MIQHWQLPLPLLPQPHKQLKPTQLILLPLLQQEVALEPTSQLTEKVDHHMVSLLQAVLTSNQMLELLLVETVMAFRSNLKLKHKLQDHQNHLNNKFLKMPKNN